MSDWAALNLLQYFLRCYSKMDWKQTSLQLCQNLATQKYKAAPFQLGKF